MKFSIITPTLNQADFIEDTIISVLDQNYPDFEHIIIDGGSTDGTIDILKKYPHLKWISEKDSGQSNAINKGFRMATGDIIAWINSDDYYEKNIFNKINESFTNIPNCNFLYGDITYVDINKNYISKTNKEEITYQRLITNPDIVRQPSCFWKKDVLKEIGYLNEKLHLIMDYEFFLRISKRYSFYYLNDNFSYFRYYSDGKSSKYIKKQFLELLKLIITNPRTFSINSYLFLIKKFYNVFLKTCES